jgi:hypothetical protein
MLRRKRVRAIFALPIVIFLALIGWSLLGLDSKQKEVKAPGQTSASKRIPVWIFLMLPNNVTKTVTNNAEVTRGQKWEGKILDQKQA